MDTAYLVIAHVLLLSALAVVLAVSLRTNRRLHEHLESEQNAYHQLLQLTNAKPPSSAGTFVLSDRELATREASLLAASRQRAAVLDADARQRLTRAFRRGSRSSRSSSPGA